MFTKLKPNVFIKNQLHVSTLCTIYFKIISFFYIFISQLTSSKIKMSLLTQKLHVPMDFRLPTLSTWIEIWGFVKVHWTYTHCPQKWKKVAPLLNAKINFFLIIFFPSPHKPLLGRALCLKKTLILAYFSLWGKLWDFHKLHFFSNIWGIVIWIWL